MNYNPFLPENEYIADPEVRIFDGRVFLYGSHDKFNGYSFCLNDYVAYSASLDNLNDWKYEGVIYSKNQDPHYKKFKNVVNTLFAPNVIKGKDNKYYLYYCLGFSGIISVARSDCPNKNFLYYGDVKYKDGTLLGEKKEQIQFDPAILIDDERIFLYTGFAPKSFSKFLLKNKKISKEGVMVNELEDDMLTIKGDAKYILKTTFNSKHTSFEGHEFLEVSSIRKFNGIYYFVYSDINGYELCYAISNYPDKEFKYGGILISLNDSGINSISNNNTGNIHGSIMNINDSFYVFYHRQTNRNSFSRQACVSRISYDGYKFKQAEITSLGFNNILKAQGVFPSYIASNLYSTKGTLFYKVIKNRKKCYAYFTQTKKDGEIESKQYIRKISSYTIIGYKYFAFDGLINKVALNIKGRAWGNIEISTDQMFNNIIARINLVPSKRITTFIGKIENLKGTYPLYIRFKGDGTFSFYSIEFMK